MSASFPSRSPLVTVAASVAAIDIGGVRRHMRASENMKRPLSKAAAFSLCDVTLALVLAAFCLLTVFAMLPVALKTQQTSMQQTTANNVMSEILADLRADARLPPGQVSKEGESGFQLHGHWAQVYAPDTLYFTNEADMTGSLNAGTPPADAVFRATITYLFPPNASTAVAKIIVSWPAAVDPASGVPAGSVETFIAVNR